MSLGISDFCSHDVNGIPAIKQTQKHQIHDDDTDKDDTDTTIQFPFSVILKPIYHFQSPPPSENETPKNVVVNNNKKSTSIWNKIGTKQKNNNNSINKSKRPFDSFLDDFLTIPTGTAIYDIFACPDPLSVMDPTKLQRIGRIVTTSEMIVSNPDDTLFFRHQKKEEDFEYRPEWREQVKQKCSCDGGKTNGTVDKMAGWRLFESQIAKNQYVDFEQQ